VESLVIILAFNKHLLSISYMPGTVRGIGDVSLNKSKSLITMELAFFYVLLTFLDFKGKGKPWKGCKQQRYVVCCLFLKDYFS